MKWRTAIQGGSHARPEKRDRHGRAQRNNGSRVELLTASQKGEGQETGRGKESSRFEGRSDGPEAEEVLTQKLDLGLLDELEEHKGSITTAD